MNIRSTLDTKRLVDTLHPGSVLLSDAVGTSTEVDIQLFESLVLGFYELSVSDGVNWIECDIPGQRSQTKTPPAPEKNAKKI